MSYCPRATQFTGQLRTKMFNNLCYNKTIDNSFMAHHAP